MSLMHDDGSPPDYGFWPRAMLPAWFVTDKDLIVKNSNDFAKQILREHDVDLCAAGRRFSFGTVNAAGG